MKIKPSTFFLFILFIILVNQKKNIGKKVEAITNQSFETNINKVIKEVNKILPIKIKEQGKKEPIVILNEEVSKNEVIDEKLIDPPKDFISPDPNGSTEYRFVNESPKSAWSEVNVSQHPKFYTSDIKNEIIDPSKFFNTNHFFHDNTSPDAVSQLPDRCIEDENGNIFCNYNNRLQLVPPSLVTNIEGNLVLNSVGTLHKDRSKAIVNIAEVHNIAGNNYKVWSYNNESINNGGKYFNTVYGYEGNKEYQELKNLNGMNKDYSF